MKKVLSIFAAALFTVAVGNAVFAANATEPAAPAADTAAAPAADTAAAPAAEASVTDEKAEVKEDKADEKAEVKEDKADKKAE